MDNVPVIKPIKTKEYHVPESRYKQAGKLPFRSIILGSSGSGKTILLQNMIIDIYKKMNEYIYFHQALMLITRRGCLSKNT
jgi:DNA replication protein DnaC